jgi:hypothetical protein
MITVIMCNYCINTDHSKTGFFSRNTGFFRCFSFFPVFLEKGLAVDVREDAAGAYRLGSVAGGVAGQGAERVRRQEHPSPRVGRGDGRTLAGHNDSATALLVHGDRYAYSALCFATTCENQDLQVLVDNAALQRLSSQHVQSCAAYNAMW